MGKLKSAIYYCFSGKEEIFTELVKNEAWTFLGKMNLEVDQSTDDPQEKF